jgi:hypothetical protein
MKLNARIFKFGHQKIKRGDFLSFAKKQLKIEKL